MKAGKGFARPMGVAFVALVATPALAGEFLAAERASFRHPKVSITPAVVALTGLAKAPSAKPLVEAFNIADAPGVVAVIDVQFRLRPAAPDSLDLAWATLAADRRALASALDDWASAPEVARDLERRRARAAIAAAYVARGFEPFWTESGSWRAAAAPVLARLRQANDDGLDLRGYALPEVELGTLGASQELALSEAVATYARQARGSRIEPERISRLIGARTTLPDSGQAVAEVAAVGAGAGEILQAFNPPHYGYRQLREKLMELRAQRSDASTSEGLLAEATEGAPLNDAAPTDGKARRRRAAATRATTSRVEAEVLANMERWRWLPRDMGEERVEVNIPDFELAVVRNGEVAHRTRVIVGKETTPTPIFSDEMEEIIVNPSWYVPQSIIQKEWGGGVGAGYQVSYRRGEMVVRQPPGPGNALGRIKFVFPNDYAVYMHDTPSRGLFAASHRAFSHGCMRVQEPFALAEAVLGPGSGWSESRVKKLIGASERYINLPKPLPVHVEYFTAYVDEAGRLVQRPDLYGYSARVRRALGLEG